MNNSGLSLLCQQGKGHGILYGNQLRPKNKRTQMHDFKCLTQNNELEIRYVVNINLIVKRRMKQQWKIKNYKV